MNRIDKTSDKYSYWHQFIVVVNEWQNIDFTYDQLAKVHPLYSGNLDSKQINKILRKYGIEKVIGDPSLREIKKFRNQLAHGELSFEEIGRQVSFERLKILYEKTFRVLDDVIQNTETYIQGRKYRKR